MVGGTPRKVLGSGVVTPGTLITCLKTLHLKNESRLG